MPTIDLGYVIGPQGPQGNPGPTGADGVQGNPGPNQVTGSTSTTLNGILQGNGSVVQAVQSDSQPVADSTNIVRSGPVFSALQKHGRKNLFDNWYFVGGGGAINKFPVAQKSWAGTTSLTGTGYFVDRWYSYNADQVTALQADGVHISNSNGVAIIQQHIEPFNVPVGTTLTSSVLFKGQLRLRDNFTGTTRNAPGSASGSSYANTDGAVGILSLTTTIGAGGMTASPLVWLTAPQGVETTIYAVKLEIGGEQTLVSYDSQGNLTLTDIPNYAEELAKCQRYMLVLNPAQTTYNPMGSGYGQNSTTAYIICPVPVSLRAAPTVTVTGTPNLQSGSTQISTTAIGYYRMGIGTVMLSATAASGVSNGTFYMLLYGTSNLGSIVLDANIYPS